MSEFVILDLAGPAYVPMAGALTVRNAERIRDHVLQAIREKPTVVLDCSEAGEIDLSFIQIVMAARKTADAAGKTLSIVPPPTNLLFDTLRRAGVLDAADPSAADRHFWCNKRPTNAEDDSHRR